MLRIIRRPFEYLLARLALAVVPRLSRSTLRRWAMGLGNLGYFLIGRQRRVGWANLQLALPGRPPAEYRRILRLSLQSFVLSMLDIFWLSRDTSRRMEALVRFDPAFETVVFSPGAQVCITAHMGNWEVLGLAVSQRGYPLTSVIAPLKNPWVDRLFNNLRHLTGQTPVPKQGAVRTLLKTLKTEGKIALVLDQNVKPVHGGLFVDFFGCPAPFSAAAAQLAIRTGAPIVIGTCIADEQGNYFVPPIRPVSQENLPAAADQAALELTRRIARGLEDMIRTYPEHWLWTYKRWKIRAPNSESAPYPFYTRALRPGDLPAGTLAKE